MSQVVKIKRISAIFLFVLFFGCKSTLKEQGVQTIKDFDLKIPKREHAVQAVLWQQLSAEYKALCYQAFNVAKFRIDNILLENNHDGKPLAVITDIDETILNNSPFEAKGIITDEEYSEKNWVEWVKLEQATAIPGALEFFNYVNSKGIEIYYLSNRSVLQEMETMNNLKKIGFPSIDEKHFLLKDKMSGKEDRRQSVSKENRIVMLLGDNLSDFSGLFDNKPTNERNDGVENLKDLFGNKFIVLPNPTYGDWQTKGIYEGNYKWTEVQKDSIRKAKLISY